MSAPLTGAGIIAALKAAEIQFVPALPDIVTCDSVLWPLTATPEITVIPLCKEDEGVSLCAAPSYCERRALLLIQHTGLLDSVNALRAIAVEYSLPVCMMVGLQGLEADRPPRDSAHTGVRLMEPLLELMDLDHRVLRHEADLAAVPELIGSAYARSRPLALLVAQSPV